MKKKVVDVLILLFCCIFLFAGCTEVTAEGDTLQLEQIANADKIKVTHYLAGEGEYFELQTTEEINELANWLNDLSLEPVKFSKGETPADMEGGEVFDFTAQEGENVSEQFSYLINGGKNCYILYHEKWYQARNPSMPFLNTYE